MGRATARPTTIGTPERWRLGADLVACERVSALLGNEAALRRVFHPGELARGEVDHLTGCLAAKEATAKALGIVPPPWLDITVGTDSHGRPRLSLSPELFARVRAADCTITHAGGFALAVVILELRT